MLLALLMAALSTCGGACSTLIFDEEAGLGFRICAGVAIGMAVQALSGFLIACLLGLTPVTLILATAISAAPAILLLKPEYKNAVNSEAAELLATARSMFRFPPTRAAAYGLGYGAILLLIVLVFQRAMFYQDGQLFTGILNNWGDLPFHLATITRFAYGGNIPPEDPTFAGVHFTYPFMSDLIAAMYVQAGAELRDSILIQDLMLAFSLVGLLAVFSFQITKSRAASLLSTVLILLNGGFGWTMLAGDVKKTEGGLLDLLMHLPHDYTVISDTTWRWGNTITSLLVTQRSILMGMPLTIIVFIELWKMTAGRQSEEKPAEPATPNRGPKTKNKKAVIKRLHGTNEHHRMLGAGAVAGLLPLIHVHSFLVAMTVAGCLCLIFRSWGKWAAFFAATLVLALPQIGWLYAAAPTHFGGFFSFELGWDHSKDNAIWFWFKNTGLFIPLLLLAFVWKSGGREMISKKLLLFYAPFALCFIVPNMFKFAPWIWDNIKILIYWYIGSCPLVAMLLLQFWRRGRFARAATIFMIFIMVLAGFLDNFRIASGASEFLELDDNQVRMADFIEQATPPNALVLHTATHNNPLVLTGRRSLMGYPGHVWSHGIDIGHREDDIRQIYAGSPAAAALIAQYGIDYAIVGSQERDAMDVNDAFFRQFPDVGGVGDIRLYKLR